MSKEIVTNAGVLNFIHDNMGRELTDSEINGLADLMGKKGYFNVWGKAKLLISYAERETLDSYLGIEEIDGDFGIHDYLRSEFEDDSVYDKIIKANS